MADLLKLTIDGAEVSVPKGTLIVDAAKRIDNDIPVFCYHPKLKPVGMCRMCLVEVGRVSATAPPASRCWTRTASPRLPWAPSWRPPAPRRWKRAWSSDGASGKVQEARDDMLEFLLTSHPLDCPICDKGGECPLQNLTMAYGPGNEPLPVRRQVHVWPSTSRWAT